MRNCALWNLEIPRCAIAHLRSGPSDHPGMTVPESREEGGVAGGDRSNSQRSVVRSHSLGETPVGRLQLTSTLRIACAQHKESAWPSAFACFSCGAAPAILFVTVLKREYHGFNRQVTASSDIVLPL